MSIVFKILDRVLETMLFITLAGMSAVVASNVFCRFVLSFSFSWGDETAQILMVWLTFLGAAVATRDKSHFAFDDSLRAPIHRGDDRRAVSRDVRSMDYVVLAQFSQVSGFPRASLSVGRVQSV